MKLDRNINPDGKGKYALILLRKAGMFAGALISEKPSVFIPNDCIDFGYTPDTEFFVIRLKDKYAANALHAYATSAKADDPEYADEIFELAARARNHPNQHRPD